MELWNGRIIELSGLGELIRGLVNYGLSELTLKFSEFWVFQNRRL